MAENKVSGQVEQRTHGIHNKGYAGRVLRRHNARNTERRGNSNGRGNRKGAGNSGRKPDTADGKTEKTISNYEDNKFSNGYIANRKEAARQDRLNTVKQEYQTSDEYLDNFEFDERSGR